MKMKWKSALLALLVCGGITMTSCSDNNEGIDVIDQIEEGDSYLALRMMSDTKIIYTKAPTDYTQGHPEETVADKLLWVLYDPVSMQAKHQFVKDKINIDGLNTITGADVANPSSAATTKYLFTTVAEKVVKQKYKLLAVLNPTEKMIAATAKGKYFVQFEEAKEETVASLSSAGTGKLRTKIVMSNATDLVDVTEDMFEETKAKAEVHTKQPLVQLDRILAKVVFNISKDVDYQQDGFLANPQWVLDVTNKKTFWNRRKTFVAPALTSVATSYSWKTEDEASSLPAYERVYLYAKDPNWDGVSLLRKGGTSFLPITSEFNYMTPAAFEAGGTAQVAVAGDAPYTFEYVLENTMNADEQWEDVTTRVLMKGNYIPGGSKGIDPNQPVDFVAGDSYYFYAGVAYSLEQLQYFYKEDLWPETPAGLEKTIKDLVTAGKFTTSGGTLVGWTASKTEGAITYYAGGICYYYILIRHFDDTLSANDPETVEHMNFGRYGVVRNNIYNVTVTKISGPGKPTIPEPEGPDDKPDAFISAQVQVLPWVIRNQDAEI